MSRVLFLANNVICVYNFRLELVEELLKLGHSVIISCPYSEKVDELVKLGAEHRDIKIDRHGTDPVKDLKLVREYKRLINETHPDVVLTFTIKPNIFGATAARSCRVPCIANITGLGIAIENGGVKKRICISLYKYAFKKIERVFFQNEANRKLFEDHRIAVGRHKLLPGSGVNLDRFHPTDLPRDEVFLFIARIMKDKGIDEFLEASARIKAVRPDVRSFVCGFCDDANYDQKLIEAVNDGVIEYFGMTDNQTYFYAAASCVVLPSYHEGMSNTLLEAAACARPIIATDVPGCREIIEDGKTGFLVKRGSAEDLYEKMLSFLDLSYEQRKKMGLDGRKKMENEFDRAFVVKEYVSEINRLTDPDRRRNE